MLRSSHAGAMSRLAGVVAVLGVLPAAALAAGPDVLGSIDACAAKLNPDIDIGYERIVARCPQLTRRLAESPWAAWLPRDWQRPGNDLSAAGLRELHRLLANEAVLPARTGPGVASVARILARVREDSGAPGWWSRTRAWLRALFGWDRDTGDAGGGLTHLTGRIGPSQAVLERVTYVAAAVVLLLALTIVANELRAQRVFARLRGLLPRRVPRDAAAPASGVLPGWETIAAAPPLLRPGMLFEAIVLRLRTESDCAATRGMTVRELARAMPLSSRDRAAFNELARVSEWVRFAGTALPPDSLAAALETGRALLERIGANGAGVGAGVGA